VPRQKRGRSSERNTDDGEGGVTSGREDRRKGEVELASPGAILDQLSNSGAPVHALKTIKMSIGFLGGFAMGWVTTVLTSEFFWGVMVGLVLSVVGSYYLAKFAADQQRKSQKEVVKNFCADTVSNLRQIVDDMVDVKRKANLIHGDYLTLIDVETGVFGRNREHLIHLPQPLRDKVRRFVNECGLRRAEIGNHLALFQSKWKLADELTAAGQGPQAQRVRDECQSPLADANKVLDTIATHVQNSANLVSAIKSIT
jgi:hypothetical protein